MIRGLTRRRGETTRGAEGDFLTPPSIDHPEARPLSRWSRLGLFILVVAGASLAGGLVEWTTRWLLPSTPATFLGRIAMLYPVLYWMPLILAETPPWTRRKRIRFAGVGALLLSAAGWVLAP